MDYGKVLRRAWDVIWEHKFLILLGVLVALGSGGGGAGVPSGSGGTTFGWDAQRPEVRPPRDFPQFPEMPDFRRGFELPVLPVMAIVILIGIALVLGLAFWVVSTIARGGLIAGVSAIDAGEDSSFSAAWRAGWRKGWTLLGIGILPAIPGLVLFLVGLAAAGIALGLDSAFGDQMGVRTVFGGLGAVLVALACVVLPFVVLLNLLQAFANRACMLGDMGVIAAYRRGLSVLVDNLGPAVVLFLIQIGIGIVLGILMIVPGIFIALCCVLWPLFLLIQGSVEAYFSTVWTVAWREWTVAQVV